MAFLAVFLVVVAVVGLDPPVEEIDGEIDGAFPAVVRRPLVGVDSAVAAVAGATVAWATIARRGGGGGGLEEDGVRGLLLP